MFISRSITLVLAAIGALGAGAANPAVAAPVIANLKMTPATLTATGGAVTITATVTDTVPVTSVSAYVATNGSKDSNVTIPMSNSGAGSVYTGVFPVTHYNLTAAPYAFNVTLTAKDATSTQTAIASTAVTQANDNLPPAIGTITLSPSTLTLVGGLITVKATIIDPGKRPITSAVARMARNGVSYTDVPLSNGGTGSVYSGVVNSNTNNTSNTPITYAAYVTATNDLGLSYSISGGSAVQANSDIPPVISKAVMSSNTLPATGGVITFTAVVTDPNGRPITSVTAKVVGNGSNYGVTLSNGGSGNIYTATTQWGAKASGWVFSGTVVAIDDLGLSNAANINGTQGYAYGTLPELVAPSATSVAVSPASITKGSANLTLALNGINFQAGCTVLFNGKKLTPTNISTTAIIVVVPSTMLTSAGAFEVSVVSPTGGVSNGITFNVY